ncbi:transposase [Cupriavidus necator]|uniref:transposase n=1 Tax=Cupriavidus necator TaxID=106590 RepID=UPI00339D59EE
MAKTRVPYAAAFRQQMIDLVHAGRTPEDLAKEFEPTAQTIYNWVAQADRDAGKRHDGLSTAERQALTHLRRELRQAKGNAVAARMSRRLGRAYDMGTALDGIRQTAKGRPGAKFTTLMHHIYAVDRLRAAYFALERKAAAGVGGQTWQSYGLDPSAAWRCRARASGTSS